MLGTLLMAAPRAAADPARRDRVVGAGFGVGVGPAATTGYGMALGSEPDHYTVSLGSFELMVFGDDDFSVDVSLQPWMSILYAVGEVFGWTSTVYLDWSFGDDVRFVIGPGLGVSGHTPWPVIVAPAGAELDVAGLIGVEYLRDDRLFGFRLMTRPWLAIGGGNRGLVLGGGAMIEAVLMFYAL